MMWRGDVHRCQPVIVRTFGECIADGRSAELNRFSYYVAGTASSTSSSAAAAAGSSAAVGLALDVYYKRGSCIVLFRKERNASGACLLARRWPTEMIV